MPRHRDGSHQVFKPLRYLLSGSLGTVTNLTVATVLFQLGLPLQYSTPAGFFAGGQVAFWMHLHYSFEHRGHQGGRQLKRFVTFESVCLLVALANYSVTDILERHTPLHGGWLLALSFVMFVPLGAAANNWLVFPKQPPQHHP